MLYTFNIITFLVVLFVIVFGYEECMKLVMYVELRIKLIWIEYRMYRMRMKLKKELEGMRGIGGK